MHCRVYVFIVFCLEWQNFVNILKNQIFKILILNILFLKNQIFENWILKIEFWKIEFWKSNFEVYAFCGEVWSSPPISIWYRRNMA